MSEKEFITYDGVKFRKYKGEEIGNTGHYQIEVDKIEDTTIAGTYLDNQENINEFKKMFYTFINMGTATAPNAGYNYILIGKNYLKTFHRFVHYNATLSATTSNFFEEFLKIIKSLGLVNTRPVIEEGSEYKRMKISIISRDPPYKTFDLYFIPTDNKSISLSNNTIDKGDII